MELARAGAFYTILASFYVMFRLSHIRNSRCLRYPVLLWGLEGFFWVCCVARLRMNVWVLWLLRLIRVAWLVVSIGYTMDTRFIISLCLLSFGGQSFVSLVYESFESCDG